FLGLDILLDTPNAGRVRSAIQNLVDSGVLPRNQVDAISLRQRLGSTRSSDAFNDLARLIDQQAAADRGQARETRRLLDEDPPDFNFREVAPPIVPPVPR